MTNEIISQIEEKVQAAPTPDFKEKASPQKTQRADKNAFTINFAKGARSTTIKQQLKSNGCHWCSIKRSWSCPISSKVPIEHLLEAKKIKATLESCLDDYFNKTDSKKKADDLWTRIDLMEESYHKEEQKILVDEASLHKPRVDRESPYYAEEIKKIEERKAEQAKRKDEIEQLRNSALLIEDLIEDEISLPYTEKTIPEKAQTTFKPYSFADLLKMPPKEWVVEKVMGSNDLGMIYGAPGTGKTFIVIDLIFCACLGRPFAGCFSIHKPLKVAYCAGEGLGGLPARFEAAGKRYSIDLLDNLTFYKTIPQLFLEGHSLEAIESMNTFIQECKERNVTFDILFIDTLHSATTGAEENSAKDTGKILSMCRFAAKELKCTVVLVHHTNKNATAERGSSALRGAMDFMIEIAKSESSSNSCMKCAKLKDGEVWKPVGFKLSPTEGSKSVCVEWIESVEIDGELNKKELHKQKLLEIIELYGLKRTSKELAEEIGLKSSPTCKLLDELCKEKKCQREVRVTGKKRSSTNPYLYWV